MSRPSTINDDDDYQQPELTESDVEWYYQQHQPDATSEPDAEPQPASTTVTTMNNHTQLINIVVNLHPNCGLSPSTETFYTPPSSPTQPTRSSPQLPRQTAAGSGSSSSQGTGVYTGSGREVRYYAVWKLGYSVAEAGVHYGYHPQCWSYLLRCLPLGQYSAQEAALRRAPGFNAAVAEYQRGARQYRQYGLPEQPAIYWHE